jgi:hypothetical protein
VTLSAASAAGCSRQLLHLPASPVLLLLLLIGIAATPAALLLDRQQQ